MSAVRKHSLDHLNGTPVAPRELLEIIEILHDAGADMEAAGLALVARMYAREPSKAIAISARMHALLRVLEHEAVRRWTLPRLANGTIRTREELIVVAALQPLTAMEDDFIFDMKAFLDSVLELVEPEGNA